MNAKATIREQIDLDWTMILGELVSGWKKSWGVTEGAAAHDSVNRESCLSDGCFPSSTSEFRLAWRTHTNNDQHQTRLLLVSLLIACWVCWSQLGCSALSKLARDSWALLLPTLRSSSGSYCICWESSHAAKRRLQADNCSHSHSSQPCRGGLKTS